MSELPVLPVVMVTVGNLLVLLWIAVDPKKWLQGE